MSDEILQFLVSIMNSFKFILFRFPIMAAIMFVAAIYHYATYDIGSDILFLAGGIARIAYYATLPMVVFSLLGVLFILIWVDKNYVEHLLTEYLVWIGGVSIVVYLFAFGVLHIAYPAFGKMVDNQYAAGCLILLALSLLGIPARFWLRLYYSIQMPSPTSLDTLLFFFTFFLMFFFLPLIGVAHASYLPFDPLISALLCLGFAAVWNIAIDHQITQECEASYQAYLERKRQMQ